MSKSKEQKQRPDPAAQRAGNIENARRYLEDAQRFVQDFTGGVQANDVRNLFRSDATAAYQVLARDAPDEPKDDFKRLLHRIKTVFLGLAFQLTPARRLLFVACLLTTVLGLIEFAPRIDNGALLIDASPFWFFWSIGGLIFLLTLELVDQVRVRDELEVARQLQTDLLPTQPPELEQYRIAHSYRTAHEVGGDYYDFVRLEDGRIALLAGDASGHGMAAGLLMAIAKSTVGLAIELDPDPVAVLNLLNTTLCRTGGKRSFMSLFYGVLDPDSGTLEYANAGHPYPYLRRTDGTVTELGKGGLPLGLRPVLRIEKSETELDAGDLLLLYSDGLPEAVAANGSVFGYERLGQLIEKGGGAREVHERVRLALDDHLDGQEVQDDFSLVVVRRLVMPGPLPTFNTKATLTSTEVRDGAPLTH